MKMRPKYLQPLILITLILVAGILSHFIFKQKKENMALRLMVRQMEKKFTRPNPKSWPEILPRTVKSITALPESAATTKTTTLASKIIELGDLETTELAQKLNDKMKNFQKLTAAQVDESISITDEIISREPDVYSAYKAKLILLLVKEGKFKQEIEDDLINDYMDIMTDLDMQSSQGLKKETFLLARANSDIAKNEGKLDELSESIENINDEINSITSDSSDRDQLIFKRDQMIEEQEETLAQLEKIENSIEDGLLQDSDYVNEDVVEIPFLRSLAKGDYDEVINQANVFIERYPDSVIGHYYLIRALELNGQETLALEEIENLTINQKVISKLQEKLENSKSEKPGDYWKKLRF